ncbi:hypothetical protein T265_14253 [Opisthorchis viverrini]|uniref:Uncharacterized protein n=1 Tax=Opisthorchis viverrini TaxID=6198 RepID=A0A074ZDJ8_OPIVI|nr:hypothetical protein T265_14253 [Opisthorchis viverrini]KER25248.1 hypothetical protein T265_14253 [Opisthorchis viverrini]
MSRLISKVFCLTSYDGIEDTFQNFADHSLADIVSDFHLTTLMDDDFIAGFCTKGDVTILPLEASTAFDFSVEKWFRLDLRTPKFRRNSRLHQRLKGFLKASLDPIDSIRVPPDVLKPRPCLVCWSPRVEPTPHSESRSTPLPQSLAAHLTKNKYFKLRPTLTVERWSEPVHLPNLFDSPFDDQPGSDVNPDSARLAYTILSGLATGIVPPPSQSVAVQPNPCVCEPRLAPLFSLNIREATSLGTPYQNPVLIQLTGLFMPGQVDELEGTIRQIIKQRSNSRGFLFFATQPFSLGRSCNPCSADEYNVVARLFISDPAQKSPFVTINFKMG